MNYTHPSHPTSLTSPFGAGVAPSSALQSGPIVPHSLHATHDRAPSDAHFGSDEPDLLDLLLARLSEAPDKRAIQGLLRAVNDQNQLPRGDLRITGKKDELLQNIRDAAKRELLPIKSLATFVDRLEENGGQHLFLFDLTQRGREELNPTAFQQAFSRAPGLPTAAMYAKIPDESRIHFLQRGDVLVAKQIHTATFWEKDEERSYSRASARATVVVRRQRRALNMLRVLPERQQAEIRIDRINYQIGDEEIRTHLQAFLKALESLLYINRHLSPTPIWNGFRKIVKQRDGTYMSTDGAANPTVSIQISNRRSGTHGTDVRDHQSYQFAADTFVRNRLNIYWDTESLVGNRNPERGDPERVHTILSRFNYDDCDYGKVYIAATISPEVLSSVTERIRVFAR